jgi:RNA polymerase sigma-70 factor (ECF subfamily)
VGGGSSAASRAAGDAGPSGAQRVDDAELARRIVAGDAGAFDRFYEEQVGRVYAVTLRLCGDEGIARRLTQDVFVRAWRGMATYRGESRLSSWLYRIATNVALEHGRRRTRWWSRRVQDPGVLADRPGRSRDPGLRMDLERAIAGLPPGAREVLVLRDVEGHSYREIAELTGSAMGTVKAQIHRARRLVREALER